MRVISGYYYAEQLNSWLVVLLLERVQLLLLLGGWVVLIMCANHV